MGIKCYWVNAEKHWLGLGDEPDVSDPLIAMAAYVAAFRAVAPGVTLVNNSMTGWMSYDIRGDREIALLQLFDVYAPMVYAKSRETQKKKWVRGFELARAAGRPYAPMLGSGREEGGSFWGYFYSGGSEAGVLELQKDYPAEWLTFWIAPSDPDRLWAANEQNPAIIDFKAEVQA
jgi:hypothetical protein